MKKAFESNTYKGTWEKFGCKVTVNGEELPLRLDLYNHSPTGFAWGYLGSGPSQLALALLAYEFGDEFALDHYQDFKFEVIAGLPDEDWRLTGEELRSFF